VRGLRGISKTLKAGDSRDIGDWQQTRGFPGPNLSPPVRNWGQRTMDSRSVNEADSLGTRG